jgi:hypothetical protein
VGDRRLVAALLAALIFMALLIGPLGGRPENFKGKRGRLCPRERRTDWRSPLK